MQQYHDYGSCEPLSVMDRSKPPYLRGGRPPFPSILHTLLDEASAKGYEDVVRWCDHGRAFRILDKERFATEILDLHFRNQCGMSSFQRQLNM